MISCLMVTQPGRELLVADSLFCFAQQDFEARELVIVHDGDQSFHHGIEELLARHPHLQVTLHQELPGKSLGALRNISIDNARFDIVCQWDDDDLYHPQRLSQQLHALKGSGSDFCFLSEQLHYFSKEAFFFWDDWSGERFPGNLIQGSLLGYKNLMGKYPNMTKGEDTDLVFRLQKEGKRLHALAERAWLYIYTFHGDNAWDASHHKAIARVKRYNQQQLKEQEDTLARELDVFKWKFETAYFPHEDGGLTFKLGSGEQ